MAAGTQKQFSPDPRLGLPLVMVLGWLVWKASLVALVVYLLLLMVAWGYGKAYTRAKKNTFKRIAIFALFWPCMTLALEGVWAIAAWIEGAAPYDQAVSLFAVINAAYTGPALSNAAHLFLRLLVLLASTMLLTQYVSARNMALGVHWFLRPLSPAHAWRVALAFSLMLHYLPYINSLLVQLRLTARLRGVPASGLLYWRRVLPQLLGLLAGATWAQSMAIASRNLDSADAWRMHQVPATREVVGFVGTALVLAGIFVVV